MNYDSIKIRYDRIFKIIVDKQEEKLQENTIQYISYYSSISNDYLKDIKSYIKSPTSKVSVKTIGSRLLIGEENNNYSTNLIGHVSELVANYNALVSDLNHPFKLFVMGTGNYGKSAVINSLLGTGEKHATEATIPKTWKIDIFLNSSNLQNAIVKYRNGTEKTMSIKDAEKLIEKEEALISAQLKKITEDVKSKIKNKIIAIDEAPQYRISQENQKVKFSDIVEVHWKVKNSSILETFSVVDTPGLNQKNASGDVINSAKDYYNKADGVLWLLDANVINGKNSNVMLKELNDTLRIDGKKRANDTMIAVLNKMDKLQGNHESVEKEANRIYGKFFSKIIPYSAKQAFEAAEKFDDELASKSGRTALLNEIKQTFYHNAKRIQCGKKNEACEVYNHSLTDYIQNYHQQMSKDLLELEKRISYVKKTFLTEKKLIIEEFNTELNEYIDTFNAEIEWKLKTLSEIVSTEDQKKYVKDNIYQLDQLYKLSTSYHSKSSENIRDISENLQRETIFTQYDKLRRFLHVKPIEIISAKNITFNNYSAWMPDMGKSALYSAAGAGLVFGPLGALIGGGIGLWASNKMRNESIIKFVEEYNEIIKRLVSDFSKTQNIFTYQSQTAVIREMIDSYCVLYSLNINTRDYKDVVAISNKILNIGEETLINLKAKRGVSKDLLSLITTY